MKKYLLLFCLLIASANVFGQKAPQIHYYSGSLQDFQVAAKDKRIPSILYLHGDNDAQQILYDKRVMNDSALVRFTDSCMLAYQLNVNEDYNTALHYQIEDLPVYILFDRNGWEIDRLYGYHKPEEIIKFMKQGFE